MKCKYPNLELLEYKVYASLVRQKEFQKKFKVLFGTRCSNPTNTIKMEALVYLQKNAISCANEFYVTIFKIPTVNIYAVCFGNDIEYFVHEPNKAFFDDVENRQLRHLEEARKRYENK